ncbi:MAG: PAS domain S-box protein [Rhodomicrobium sp.]
MKPMPTIGLADKKPAAERGQELAAQRLAAIVESSDDAILSKDLNGIITSWNRGAERIFGYIEEETLGKPVTMLMPPERHNEEPTILARIRRGERVDHYETVRQRKDGSLIDISLTVSPIKDANGQVVGASKIARDISERKRAEERRNLLLREMNHRIKNLFAIAGSVVALSAREADTPKALARSAGERLAALGRAHELTLTRPSDESSLEGPKPTTVHALIKAILLPFANTGSEERATIIGVGIPIGANQVTALALIFHEFAINAAKYGALSVPEGRIDIECVEDEGQFHLDWQERGGPEIVQASNASGFGSLLVHATIHQLGGEIVRETRREGVHIRLAIPLGSLSEKEGT